MSNIESRINDLEERILELEMNNKILENLLVTKAPDWAELALEKVKHKGEIPYPFIRHSAYGSYDYYRIIDLLVKNEII